MPTLLPERKAIHGFIVMARFHVALRCRRTIHVTQGLHVNWGEPAFSLYCADKVCIFNQSGRHAKEMQVVGGPNSTDEGMNKINTRGKSRENCSSQFWPAKLYQRGNISYTQR